MDVMKPGTRQHGAATLRLAHNPTIPAHLRGGLLELSHLYVPHQHRAQGLASMLLQKVCAEADRGGKVLMLTPKPFGVMGPDANKLAEWYGRFGFDIIQVQPVTLMARRMGAEQRHTMKALDFSLAASRGELAVH